ncbi:MAG: motility associated factor glycosyltransferase family protein [Chlamydiia bacterium]|nr:motility associated factor glycosyltransferase family protein [Chlamydiia bacterium]
MEVGFNGRAMVQTDLFETRYPNLSFLLRFHEIGPISPKSEVVEIDYLEKLDVVYVYGLGLGATYPSLKRWLSENQERDLVFIEENLGAVAAFLQSEYASEILAHPQVHIRFNLNKKRLNAFLKECAESFPFENIGVFATPSNMGSRFYRLRLKLHRYTTIQHALFLENHYYNLFFNNLHENFYRMETAFNGNGLKGSFQKTPAIICGAGPSLANDIETLRTLNHQALIIAGGSAITVLSHHGIEPHFGMAIDPNEEEVKRFKEASTFEVPLLYATRLHPDIFQTRNGPHGYLQTGTGGAAEKWLEKKLQLQLPPLQEGFTIEALSVTTTAIEFAATLGCDPIILLGVDLAFTGGKTYASGVASFTSKKKEQEVRTGERLLRRKDIYGNPIQTLVKWVMESSAISTFAKCNPHIKVINATSGGMGFKDIPHAPLNDIKMPFSQDLYAKVHQLIQTHPLPVKKGKIKKHLKELKKSLLKAKQCIEMAHEELEKTKGTSKEPETGRLIFAQLELETLDAYTCFLKDPDQTFLPTLERRYRPPSWKEIDPTLKWHYLHAKWSAYEDLVSFYLRVL